MRATFYLSQGLAAQVLQIGELPDPEPGPGEVRVRVHASAVNPSDTKGRGGWGGAPMPYPRIVPHQDGAGVVDRVGPGVPAMTAHRCLFADGELRGQWVLVQGGAGAVGLAAVLLAKWAGAHVVATVSRPEQARAAHDAGADLILDRKTDDVAARVREATGGQGVARIVDVAICANIAVDMACIGPNGAIAAYAAETPDAMLGLPFLPAMRNGTVLRGVFVYGMPEQAHRDATRDINLALQGGAYRPLIGLRLPLDRVAEAHDAQDGGRVVGKIVLAVA